MQATKKLPEKLKNEQWSRIFAWVLQTQREDIQRRYSDQVSAQHLRDFFFDNLYPDLDMRIIQDRRNRDFVRISNNWLLKMILGDERIQGLKTVVQLHEYTDLLDMEIVDCLYNKLKGADPSTLTVEDYYEAFRLTSSRSQREYQLKMILEAFDFVKKIVGNPRYSLEYIIKKIPRILIRNSDLLTFSINTYNAFKESVPMLAEYEQIIMGRERAQFDAIFGPEE